MFYLFPETHCISGTFSVFPPGAQTELARAAAVLRLNTSETIGPDSFAPDEGCRMPDVRGCTHDAASTKFIGGGAL